MVHESSPTQRFITALWVFIALFVPSYRILPGTIGTLWTLAVLGLIVISVIGQRVERVRYAPVWILAAYAAMLGGLSSSANSSLAATLYVAVQFVVVLALGPFVIRYNITHDRRFLPRVIGAFLLTQSVSSIVGLAQYGGFTVWGPGLIQGRATGLADHPNVFGVMAGIAVSVCLHGLLTRPRKRLAAIVMLLNAAGLLSTGSISSLVACLLGALVLTFALNVSMLKILGIVLVVAASGWVVLQFPTVSDNVITFDRIAQVTGRTEQIGTLGTRIDTIEFGWDYIQRDPVYGRGLDASSGGTGNDGQTGPVLHDFLFRAWFQGGIFFGLGALLLFVAVTSAVAANLRRRTNALSAAILVTVFSFALTSAFFEQAYYWLPVLAAWGAQRPGTGSRQFDGAGGNDSGDPAPVLSEAPGGAPRPRAVPGRGSSIVTAG